MEYQPTETIHALQHLLESLEGNLRELQTHPELPGYLIAELTHMRTSAKLSLLDLYDLRDGLSHQPLHSFKTTENVQGDFEGEGPESTRPAHPLEQRNKHYEVCERVSTTLLEMRSGAVS